MSQEPPESCWEGARLGAGEGTLQQRQQWKGRAEPGVPNSARRRRFRKVQHQTHSRALQAAEGICLSFYMGSKVNVLSKGMI